MATNIITFEDLQNFKQALLTELRKILSQWQTLPARKRLRSHEVKRLLTLSSCTLQNLRVNGKLPFTKIGGVIFYDYDDIQKMIEENKTNSDIPSRKNSPWQNV